MDPKNFMCALKTNLALPPCLYGLLFPHPLGPFQAQTSGFEGHKPFIFAVEGLQIFVNLGGKNLRKYLEYLAREDLTIPPGASSLAADPSKQISAFCKFLANIFLPPQFRANHTNQINMSKPTQ